MNALASRAAVELDAILTEFDAARKRSKHSDISDLEDEPERTVAVMRAAIERWTPAHSTYRKVLDELTHLNHGNASGIIRSLPGILRGLRDDFKGGRLDNFEQIVHADVFSDFLEMATHLLSQGYKDAAAVITGATLEEHIRKLCSAHAVSTSKPDGTPKKLDAMNSELAKAGAYSLLDQKSVTTWADLRNNAAHGNYAAYSKEQVALTVQSVRDFMARYPA